MSFVNITELIHYIAQIQFILSLHFMKYMSISETISSKVTDLNEIYMLCVNYFCMMNHFS